MSNHPSSEELQQEPTPEQPPTQADLAGEWRWLVALAVAVCGLTVFLLTLGPQGGDIANVLALPVTIASLIVTVIFYRKEHPRNAPKRQGSPQMRGVAARRPVLVAAVTTSLVATIVSGAIVLVPPMIKPGRELPTTSPTSVTDSKASSSQPPVGMQEPEANNNDKAALALYLSGEVTVGINGTLPGWSKSSSPSEASGFDPALVKFLQTKYNNFTVRYVNLRPWEREDALESHRVKLVVANYSRTDKRAERVDFAGPYFHDRSGILCWDEKISCDEPISQSSICVTKKTTAYDNLPGAQHRNSLVECMEAFYDRRNTSIGAISTDLTILQAYGSSIGSVGTVTWANKRDHPISEEYYGIGLPNNRPDLCRALSDEIDDFLKSPSGWASAFNSNLAGQDSFARNPERSSRSWCDSSDAVLP